MRSLTVEEEALHIILIQLRANLNAKYSSEVKGDAERVALPGNLHVDHVVVLIDPPTTDSGLYHHNIPIRESRSVDRCQGIRGTYSCRRVVCVLESNSLCSTEELI